MNVNQLREFVARIPSHMGEEEVYIDGDTVNKYLRFTKLKSIELGEWKDDVTLIGDLVEVPEDNPFLT